MREDAFRLYLQNLCLQKQKQYGRSISDKVSRCKKVEHDLRLDLDTEYARDRGRSLLERLAYSREDTQAGKEPPLSLRAGADPCNCMSSYRSDVRRYFEFRTAGQ